MFSVVRRVHPPKNVLARSPTKIAFRPSPVRTCSTAACSSPISDIPTGFKLHTPGFGLSTTATVRQSMLHEVGAGDKEAEETLQQIRSKVLSVGEFPPTFDCVVMEGAGSLLLESAISTIVPPNGKLLVIRNGEAGERIKQIAEIHNIQLLDLPLAEDTPLDLEVIKEKLSSEEGITHLVMAHCETGNGMLLPWPKLVDLVNELPPGKRPILIADATYTFGGTDMSWAHSLDFLVASGSESLQGVPGLGFIIFNKESASKVGKNNQSVSLDFIREWKAGNTRALAPTHLLNALSKALAEYEEEGGWKARQERYNDNRDLLVLGMISMGFKTFLKKDLRSNVVTTFYHPTQPTWNWEKFSNFLLNGRFVIYPGNINGKDTFRIGSIGHIVRYDIVLLLDGVKAAKTKMKF